MQPYNDRWERTKRYLLRKFLVNPAFQLSPISEEGRSSSSGAGSPESLPELVVEREPDRHDHAPEYYAGLERRMQRYYRQLFLGETGSSDEDSSNFEVNQSMASTFIINNNVVTDEKSAESDKYEEEPEIKDGVTEEISDSEKSEDANRERSNSLDKINDVTETIKNNLLTYEEKYDSDTDEDTSEANCADTEEKSAESDKDEDKSEANDVGTDEESYDPDKDKDMSEGHTHNFKIVGNHEDCLDLNKRTESSDENTSNTKSDSGPRHVSSTTVAEIHEIRPARAITQKFDGGSPVLMPRFVRVDRGVSGSGAGPGGRNNVSQPLSEMFQISHDIIEKDSSDNANEFGKDEATIEKQPTNVEKLLTVSEITKVSHNSEPHDLENVLKASKTDELDKKQEVNAVDESNGHIEDEKELRYSDSQSDDEESIGSDQFNYSTFCQTKLSDTMGIHNDSDWEVASTDSFQIALRRGLFESKHVRKTHAQSTDKEISLLDENFEPVEEIRCPRELGVHASLPRASGDTRDSPVLALEKKASAEKLEDTSDLNENSVSFEKDADINVSKDWRRTPPAPTANAIGSLDDIWSVSPVELDIEQLSNETSQDKKRRIDSGADESINKRQHTTLILQNHKCNTTTMDLENKRTELSDH